METLERVVCDNTGLLSSDCLLSLWDWLTSTVSQTLSVYGEGGLHSKWRCGPLDSSHFARHRFATWPLPRHLKHRYNLVILALCSSKDNFFNTQQEAVEWPFWQLKHSLVFLTLKLLEWWAETVDLVFLHSSLLMDQFCRFWRSVIAPAGSILYSRIPWANLNHLPYPHLLGSTRDVCLGVN